MHAQPLLQQNRLFQRVPYRNEYAKFFRSLGTALLTSLLTSVLDPRYKLSYFRKMKWEESWITEARSLVKEALAKYVNHDVHHSSEDDDDVIMVRDSFILFLQSY